MNEIFSLKRFFLLLRKHLTEQHRLYLMSAVVLAGLLAFMFMIGIGNGYDQVFQKTIMQGGLILGGAVFSSLVFQDMSNRAQRILSLTLPASHLEKFLSAWFFGVILFLPAYFFVFYCVDIAAVKIANAYYNTNALIFQLDSPYIGNILVIFFVAQSIAMLGSIVFKRRQFVQTAFITFVVIFMILQLNRFLAGWLIPGDYISGGMLFGGVWVVEQGSGRFLGVPQQTSRLTELTFYLLPVLFWLTAFFKLKEKQV